jgi:thiol-disulfide isomerase/thioredoxin
MRGAAAVLTLSVLLLGGAIELAGQGGLPTLEGRPAPALDGGIAIGTRLPHPADGPELLFFWAHWCQDCKSESPTLSKIAEKYARRGLVIVAPTKRYGYAEGGRPAAPDRELRHIVKIRDTYYPFLRQSPVPVGDANYKAFGIDAVPAHVLIDRQGIVRLAQSGVMTEAELDAAVARVIER